MPPADDLADRIAEFLDAHHVMSLATCGPHGPHAANVFYARDELSLIWVSDRQSTHSESLEINPQVAATIAPELCDFDEIQGVQIFGRAYRVSDATARYAARALLARRYPILQHLSDPMIERAYSSADPYRLVPNRIVMIDNRRVFGHKETLDLQA
ncbi:MAG TPA: pyridoxamine 5'-phosphate oxidase family protein [Bradyrhizobium sp.]|nr:pyridoxamine 5'-phosphate oxidase family protein [Bradyrhizobium sp.]